MDISQSHYCGFRALLLLGILYNISFSSKGDSDPVVSLPEKKCSYPNIIGCLPCSQDNLMRSFFDTHKHQSYPDFSKFLDQEIRSGDLCEGMIDNTDVFRLSSLLRQLMGEGSHRKLVTTMVFCHHPKFTHFVNKHFCEAIIIEYLPAGVFSDPFELQHLVKREVFLSASVYGDTNLELPSALSNRSVVEIHIDFKSDMQKVVQLPLHSRYPPLDSSGYANVRIGKPDLFMRCRPKYQSEVCSWSLIDLGNSSGSNVTWRTPCGNESTEGTKEKKMIGEYAMKKARMETQQTPPPLLPAFKVRKEKLGDRITALQQLVSPFGKTDTATVLQEAIEYIKFLHDQVDVLSTPYLKNGNLMQHQHQSSEISKDGEKDDLSSRGLCLVPIANTFPDSSEINTDFWTPISEETYR